MPLYQIQNSKGQTTEVFRTIARRDCLPRGWKRVIVPHRFAFLAGAVDPKSPMGSVPKAYAEIERQGVNWRDIERSGGFSREHITRVWDKDYK